MQLFITQQIGITDRRTCAPRSWPSTTICPSCPSYVRGPLREVRWPLGEREMNCYLISASARHSIHFMVSSCTCASSTPSGRDTLMHFCGQSGSELLHVYAFELWHFIHPLGPRLNWWLKSNCLLQLLCQIHCKKFHCILLGQFVAKCQVNNLMFVLKRNWKVCLLRTKGNFSSKFKSRITKENNLVLQFISQFSGEVHHSSAAIKCPITKCIRQKWEIWWQAVIRKSSAIKQITAFLLVRINKDLSK